MGRLIIAGHIYFFYTNVRTYTVTVFSGSYDQLCLVRKTDSLWKDVATNCPSAATNRKRSHISCMHICTKFIKRIHYSILSYLQEELSNDSKCHLALLFFSTLFLLLDLSDFRARMEHVLGTRIWRGHGAVPQGQTPERCV